MGEVGGNEGVPLKRRIRILVEYQGTGFQGWQYQPRVRTLQGTLEDALQVLCRHPVRVFGSGRTDAGVHALGQVAHFDTTSSLGMERLVRGLNGILPPDFACLDAHEVGMDFDARGSAIGKVYQYMVLNRSCRSALERDRCWQVPRPLNVDSMAEALRPLLGIHDFSAYRASDCQGRNPVKELRSAHVERLPGGFIRFEVGGNAFLKHMVRNLVGTAVEVGEGRRPPQSMEEVLRGGDRTKAGVTAPPQGLSLVRVEYPEEDVPSLVPFVSGVHHLAVKVHDVARVALFYQEVLGLPERTRHLDEAGQLRSVWLGVHETVVMVERSNAPKGGGIPPFAHDPPGWHLASLQVAPARGEQWEDWLRMKGVPVVARTPFTLYLRDPEGNRLGLSSWPHPIMGKSPPG